MNRRQAIAALGAAGLAGDLAGRDQAPVLKVTVSIPELYDPTGKLDVPRTLRKAGYGLRFYVGIENVSAADVFLWADGNSEGHDSLSFAVSGRGGVRADVRRVGLNWSKNVVRAERLAPGWMQVRCVEYDPPEGKAAEWEGFPFPPNGGKQEVTLRAVFEQQVPDRPGKLAVWAGRVESPEYTIVLQDG
jgi:hypothetical protein